jgi:hypothetical protein
VVGSVAFAVAVGSAFHNHPIISSWYKSNEKSVQSHKFGFRNVGDTVRDTFQHISLGLSHHSTSPIDQPDD